ncbi:MAG: hypothetical protein ACP5N7_05835 [Candidatus Pacearchaeota archaeon]
MKELLKSIYKSLYNEDLIKMVAVEVCPPPPIVLKTNREKLIDIANSFIGIDPTPKDEQPDGYACVHSLTTIINKLFSDFPIMIYTPDFLVKLQSDKRFKATKEFKEGNIIISPTNTGNGTVVGHTGIIGKDGIIWSNASSSGLWDKKYDTLSWIDRYSRNGKLSMYLFEIL